MKETMTKRFFFPIWKCEEIESKLEQLESEGWRLCKVSGFRKFQFARSQPKTTKYFITCSFVKESGMMITEQALKSQCKANKINGNFIEFLKTTSIYRMTTIEDMKFRQFFRNIYLRHLVLQYILIALLFVLISVAGITLSCVVDKNPLFDIQHLFFAIIGILGFIVALRHLIGLFYLRKQYGKYFKSNQSYNSEE